MRQSEAKRASVMVNIEPMVYEILLALIAREDTSASGYVRGLIIKDLRDRGILPDKMLADLYARA